MTIVIESDACWVNPDDFTLGVSGTYLQTGANGDQLQGIWGGKMYGPNPGGGPNLWDSMRTLETIRWITREAQAASKGYPASALVAARLTGPHFSAPTGTMA